MKRLMLLCSILGLGIVSCKKKDKTPSKYDLLTQGKWKLSSATAAGGLIDLMASMKSCQKDNTFTLNTNKTITVDEGATKCKDSAQQTITEGNWALLNNDAQMSINGETITAGFGSITGDVVKIESSSFQIKKDTTVSGYPTSVVITFSNVK
jgi:hypothetical protein